jgi:LmbE family N-acetylglucosaminyl deacetylase
MTTAPVTLGTILSVWAHPDDETFLAGGVMAAARDRGRRVVCASATAGERGTPDPAGWPPERLGRVRRWEAAAAMTVLGIEEHRFYGLPDGGLGDHEEAGLRWVRGLLAEVRPDTILTFGPEGMTYHPDHIAVHEWVTRAWDSAGRRGRLLYAAPMAERLERFGDFYETWNVFMSDERPAGIATADLTLHLHLDGSELDRKLTALRAMATQTAEIVAAVDPDVLLPLIAEEGFLDASPETLEALGAPVRLRQR